MGNYFLFLYIYLIIIETNLAQNDLIPRTVDLMETCNKKIQKLAHTVAAIIEEANSLKTSERNLPDNCIDATKIKQKSGIYQIGLKSVTYQSFRVACDAEEENGGWLVILRRQDGSVNFDRTWDDYKAGFGNLRGEHFIGLDKLHALTYSSDQELLIILHDFSGVRRYAKYDDFRIADECDDYKILRLGRYSGNAGNDMPKEGLTFTTRDVKHDKSSTNCAGKYTGGWWYDSCFYGHLTGIYYEKDTYKSPPHTNGIYWSSFRGLDESLKEAVMMIRPEKMYNGKK